jgi:hypothetical protein
MMIHPELQRAMVHARVQEAHATKRAAHPTEPGIDAGTAQPPGREGSPGRGWSGRMSGRSGAWSKSKSAARLPS